MRYRMIAILTSSIISGPGYVTVPRGDCGNGIAGIRATDRIICGGSIAVPAWSSNVHALLFNIEVERSKFNKEKTMETLGQVCKWLIYSLLCVVADIVDTVLSTLASDSKPRASIMPSDVDTLSDEEILNLMGKASKLQPNSAIFQLTPRTVAKASQDFDEDVSDASEANALNLVFVKTTIPVPRVRRVVKRKWDYLIVMDYVQGPSLAKVWSTFSLWKKFRVAFTLRRYIRQLRRLKASPTMPPGPLSAQGPRTCESPIFGQVQSHRGPFASYTELSAFFNERCKMALDANHVPEDDPSRKELFDDSSPLVLTHQDLNPRNIIVGVDGRLWIIDWAWAGYYPPWFEYVAMQRQTENEKYVGFDDYLWQRLIPFICGPYFRQEGWLLRMSRGLYFR